MAQTHNLKTGDTFRVGAAYGFEIVVAGRQNEVVAAYHVASFLLDRPSASHRGSGSFDRWMARPEITPGDTLIVDNRRFTFNKTDGTFDAYHLTERTS